MLEEKVNRATGEIMILPEHENPFFIVKKATDVAMACKVIVEKHSTVIAGHKFPQVECWQTIAVAHGCILSARDVVKVENGYTAIGEVRRIIDGVVIATGEGYVGNDEKHWQNAQEYAKRAMAQTRAMSRAGRSAFAYVVTLMNIPNMQTTPAEEVPVQGFAKGKTKPTSKAELVKRVNQGIEYLVGKKVDNYEVPTRLANSLKEHLGTERLEDAEIPALESYLQHLRQKAKEHKPEKNGVNNGTSA